MLSSASGNDIRLSIRRIQELPPLPLAAQKLIVLLADEGVDIPELARAIELDPGLSARIIGLANSAFFGMSGTIHNIQQAIVRALGLDTVKSLAFSISITDQFPVNRGSGLDLREYWASAMLTAQLAQGLASQVQVPPRPSDEQAYLGGLLYHVGLLPLAYLAPSALAQAYRDAAGGAEEVLLEAERRHLGIDHFGAGAWLTNAWHLPTEMVHVLTWPEHRPRVGKCWTLGLLVATASSWVQDLLRDQDPAAHVRTLHLELAIPREALAQAGERLVGQLDGIRRMSEMLAGG